MTNNEYIYSTLKAGFDDDFTMIDVYNSLDDLQKSDDTAFLNLDSEKIEQIDAEYGLSRQKVTLTFELYVGFKTAKDIDRTGLLRSKTNDIIDKVKKKVFSLSKRYNQTNSGLNIAIEDVYLTEIHKALDVPNNFGLVYFIGNINYYEGV